MRQIERACVCVPRERSAAGRARNQQQARNRQLGSVKSVRRLRYRCCRLTMTYAVFDMFNVAQRKFTSRSNSGIF